MNEFIFWKMLCMHADEMHMQCMWINAMWCHVFFDDGVYRGIWKTTASPPTTRLLIGPTKLVLEHTCKMCVVVICNILINVWETCFAMILEISKGLRCGLFDKFGCKINEQVKWNALINKMVTEHTFALEFPLFSLWHGYFEQVWFSVVSTHGFP